jgi:predicted kinase
MTRVVYFNGLSGSGKTTISQEIKRNYKETMFYLDIGLIEKSFINFSKDKETHQDISFKISESTLETCLKNHIDILIDKSLSAVDIEKYSRLAEKLNSKIIKIYFYVSLSELIKRLEYKQGRKFHSDEVELIKEKYKEVDEIILNSNYHLLNTENLTIDQTLKQVMDIIENNY